MGVKSKLASAPKNKMAAASLKSTGSGFIKLTESSPCIGQNNPDTIDTQGHNMGVILPLRRSVVK
jgi:hypothetical protein